MQSNINVTDGGSGEEAVSDQNIDFEDLENDSFKKCLGSQSEPGAESTRKMSSDKDSDDAIKYLLKRNPSKLQKVTKCALFYS